MNKKEIRNYIAIIFWSFIFAVSINLFVVPFNLYNAGIIGVAQLIRTFLVNVFHIGLNIDIAGIINLLINIPIFIAAIKLLKSKSFIVKTILSVIVQSLGFMISFKESLISDILTSIIVGGVIAGFAISRILVAKGSGGGNDIIGLILTKLCPGFTVGKYSIIFNSILFVICGIAFNPEVAIYSFIQSFVQSYMIDRGHEENIDLSVMVFTKNKEVKNFILNELHRGVTTWDGKGAYTDEDKEVFISIVNKHEIAEVKARIRKIDPKAFIVITKLYDVSGGYEKRLI